MWSLHIITGEFLLFPLVFIALISFLTGYPNVSSVEDWLLTNLPPNSRIGLDPFLIPGTEFERLGSRLQFKGHTLVAIQQNLVDLVWQNRPEPRLAELEMLEFRFSGL